MENDYGQDRKFVVYSVVRNGHLGNFRDVYSLVREAELEDLEEAETWINEKGVRHEPYTILEIIRKK